MPDIIDFCPLPYDDEIRKREKEERINDIEFYKQSIAYMDTIIWKKNE